MRTAFGALTILFVACLQIARADVNPNAAPADEYFGPYQQSVLEIRNRLNDYDQMSPTSMVDPSVGGYLDHLQLAIRDWQKKYPRDPWLPWTFAHLMREYWRAGQASSPTGSAALALMRATYPDSPYTSQTVALVSAPNQELDQIARDGAEQQSYDAGQSYAAAPANAPEPTYATLPTYATANVPSSAALPSYATQEIPTSGVVSAVSSGYADTTAPSDDTPTPPPYR